MLNDTRIRALKPQEKAYKRPDGGGLHLEVRPTGARLWRYRYRLGGKENLYAIGQYPDVSLAEARAFEFAVALGLVAVLGLSVACTAALEKSAKASMLASRFFICRFLS